MRLVSRVFRYALVPMSIVAVVNTFMHGAMQAGILQVLVWRGCALSNFPL